MTKEKAKSLFAVCLALLVAINMFFISFAEPVQAEDDASGAPDKVKYLLKSQSDAKGASSEDEDSSDDEDPYEKGSHVHRDPATFEKNFDLSWEQKKETIQEIERMISEDAKITSDMSDLEKYYRLAIAGNQRVSYDWDFWCGYYNFDYYYHQWDSYGCLFDKSVCAGMAQFYAHLCHAADLPCWFVRMDPDVLDHTICFIPNINGNAYYIDITENMLFMSEEANPFEPIDLAFSHITEGEISTPTRCADNTFNWLDDDGESLCLLDIKDCYDLPYEDWFNEYALHNDTDKTFPTDYVEKGSGTPGTHYATYGEYRSNFVDKGDVWFLDDFYRDPAALKAKILGKEFDKDLVNVTGLKKNYDCSTEAALMDAVNADISNNKIRVGYFPTSRDGQVVAESADLTNGDDYAITCTEFDSDAGTAVLSLEGKGDYSESLDIPVKLNTAVVSKEPVAKKGLKYNGSEQALIEEGKADGGVMKYALGTKDEPTEEFSEKIPTGKDAGKYYVWYKVEGANGHGDIAPTLLTPIVSIAKIFVGLTLDEYDMSLSVGEEKSLSARLDNPKIQAKFVFESGDEDIATVDNKGVVTGVSGGKTYIFVNVILKEEDPNFDVEDFYSVDVVVQEPFDISETKVRFAEPSFTYNGKVQKPTITTIKGLQLEEGKDYTAEWSDEKSTDAGTYTVVVTGTGDYYGSTDATYTIKKAANPMTLKAKNAAVIKYKELKKKAKYITKTKAFTVNKAQGKLSYKLVSAKKGNKNFKNKFTVDPKTGKIKVKKGLKKGTYNVKVKVKAGGTTNYNASSWKTVTVKVRVK